MIIADANAFQEAIHAQPNSSEPRLEYADYILEQTGREDVAAMWRGELPFRPNARERIDSLTEAEKSAMRPWADRWIKIGLCTDPADRLLFEAAVSQCYLAAKFPPPRRIVWCDNPLVAVLAGAAHTQNVSGATGVAVGVAVGNAVRDAAGVAVHDAAGVAVRDAAGVAVGGAVRDAVGIAVGGAVHDAVGVAVRGAVDDLWWRYIGGQFWVGWWYWNGSPSVASFYLDQLNLRLSPHLELAARAYAATAASACWWWPTRDVVFVSERPHTLEVRPGKKPLVLWEGWGIGD